MLTKSYDSVPSSSSHTPSPHGHSTSPTPKFQFLKKSNNRRNTHSSSTEDYFDPRASPGPSSSGAVPEHIVRQLSTALATLKSQHESLLSTLNSSSFSPHGHSHHSSFDSRSSTPLRTYASRSSAAFFPVRTSSGGPTSRASSINSGETGEEYYEPEGELGMPGEFVLEDDEELDGDSGSGSGSGRDDDDEEPNSFASVEEVDEEEEEEKEREKLRKRSGSRVQSASEVTTKGETAVVVRRPQLPAMIAGDEFSMLGMLRKNVGKVRHLAHHSIAF